jgi:hypothetical protein
VYSGCEVKNMNESKWHRISELEAEVSNEEEALRLKKQLINDLRAEIGADPLYSPEELQPVMRGFMLAHLRFAAGQSLALCAKQLLDRRAACGLGALPTEDIFGALMRGGFDFARVSLKGRDQQMRGLTITLSRNPKWFAKAPDGKWGLVYSGREKESDAAPLRGAHPTGGRIG